MTGSRERLRRTAGMMASEDYKERFVAEWEQLRIRRESLLALLEAHEAGALEFEPSCPRELLEAQLDAMDLYDYLLGRRAEIEGIGEV